MRNCVVLMMLTSLLTAAAQARAPAAPAAGQAAISRAASSGKFAFVFFWKERNAETERAWADLQSGTRHLASLVDLVAVGIDDPAERELVARYDLTRAPMPLVLAIAPCGAITKAFTSASSLKEDQLRAALVSPCTQLSLKGLQDRNLVLLCILNQEGTPQSATVPQGVRDFKADERFGPVTEVVVVNANDPREAGFLRRLQVDSRAPKPMTVLMTPPGSVVGKFDSRVTKAQLVAQLAAAQSNPCAGGQCGPNGCGPRN